MLVGPVGDHNTPPPPVVPLADAGHLSREDKARLLLGRDHLRQLAKREFEEDQPEETVTIVVLPDAVYVGVPLLQPSAKE